MDETTEIFQDTLDEEKHFVQQLARVYDDATNKHWDNEVIIIIKNYVTLYKKTKEETLQLLLNLFPSTPTKKDAIHASLIGFWYQYIIVTQDNAFKYYKIAADLGDGFGITQLTIKQVYWFQKAAEKQFNPAVDELARLYIKSRYVNGDLHHALKLILLNKRNSVDTWRPPFVLYQIFSYF
ncbi:307_t:CDS:2 [Ambispora gerdemannii]|uniref:307_t:CDS:1 n=1 Tax=Ambispora gerdemannii TaxID=144530 RepID=A0A9N8WB52_9GLOM|nr:307_t:CDS:2 [Ambispora gerdemannii]